MLKLMGFGKEVAWVECLLSLFNSKKKIKDSLPG